MSEQPVVRRVLAEPQAAQFACPRCRELVEFNVYGPDVVVDWIDTTTFEDTAGGYETWIHNGLVGTAHLRSWHTC